MRDLARDIQGRFGERFPLNHVDSPFALQFYLNTARPQISTSRAAEILSGDYPAVVTVRDSAKLRSELPAATTLYEIARWPSTNKASVRVISNVPLPESTNRLAIAIGPLSIQMEDARLMRTRGEELEFAAVSPTANVTISNRSSQSQTVSLRFRPRGSGGALQTRVLEPQQSWRQQVHVDK